MSGREQREAAVRCLVELARALDATARPADRRRAQELHDYVVRFAAAETRMAHWPLDEPVTLNPVGLERAACILEEAIRSQAFPAVLGYQTGVVSFDVLDRTIRGLLLQ